MPSTLLETLLHQGLLRFEKWGVIDGLSDIPEGYASFVDCDSRKPYSWMRHAATHRILGKSYYPYAVCYKKTQRGWHIVSLYSKKHTRMELVALQAILGSDSMREALNFVRVKSGRIKGYWNQRWNILYTYKV
jgi:squalene cyclase